MPHLFQPLVASAVGANPRVFSIPYDMQRKDILPGEMLWSVKGREEREGCLMSVDYLPLLYPGSSRKELKQARLYQHFDQDQCKYCYACNMYVPNMPSLSVSICDLCPCCL